VFVSVDTGAAAPAVHVTGHACAEGAAPAPAPAPGAPRAVARRKRRRAPNLLADEVRLLFGAGPPVAPRHRPPRRLRLGVPRTLAMYRAAPFFRAYLETAGVAPGDVVFSPVTSPALWRAGARHGVSDPCFPVKVSLAHVHHLLHRVHDRGRPLDAILVPHVTHALTPVTGVRDTASCPVVAASPGLVRASLGEELARRGVAILDPVVTMTRPALLAQQMFDAFAPLLGLSRDDSDAAVAAGAAAMRRVDDTLGAAARAVLDEIEATPGRGAVLVLARPYHADPGLNHRVGEELQALGYPVFGCRAVPRDAPADLGDLAPDCVNSGAAERLWAARFAARHGRLGVVDLSSFKCGQDAPVHAVVRELLDGAGVVTCALHDLDETRPVTSLRLRLRTFAQALAARGLGPAPEAA
jgi:predicted nucleotide-binding protein (sugar kinase/HSP70/actin superfamily)